MTVNKKPVRRSNRPSKSTKPAAKRTPERTRKTAATRTVAQKRATRRTTAEHARLRQRAEQLAETKIFFVDSEDFPELARTKAAAPELPLGEYAKLPKSISREMPAHLTRMCETPLLTPQQERQFFQWMNFFKYRAAKVLATLNPKRPSAKKIAAIEEALECSKRLRNHIINANTRLVISIAKKFSDEKNPFDDLLSEGISCLMNAADKFDYSRGFRFSTYATRAVQREVWRLIQKSHKSRTRFTTGITEALDSCPADELGDSIDEMTWKGLSRQLQAIMRELDERESFIVRQRFGMESKDGKKRTFQSLGEELGVCKERVRQLEIRAMKKLRTMAEEAGMNAFID